MESIEPNLLEKLAAISDLLLSEKIKNKQTKIWVLHFFFSTLNKKL